MGLLKKLQEANGADGGGDTLDDAPEVPIDGAAAPPASGANPVGGGRHFYRPGKNAEQTAGPKDDGVRPANPGSQPQRAAPASTGGEQAESAQKTSEADAEEDDLPHELYMLRELLRSHDWGHEQSTDPTARANGQIEWTIIESQILNATAAGYAAEVRQLWRQYAPQGHAGLDALLKRSHHDIGGGAMPPSDGKALRPLMEPEEHFPERYIPFYDPRNDPNVIDAEAYVVHDQGAVRAPNEPFTDSYQRPEWAKRQQATPQSMPQSDTDADATANASAQGGGVSTDLLSKALSAPFTLTAAAGSLVLNSLKAMGDKAKSFYVKNRINGHAVLGQQLDQKALEIESLTSTLKKQGMGALINEMRATGRPAREIFDGMKDGGSYQHMRDRFNRLMADPTFAGHYTKLEGALDDFSMKATRYAQTGVELNLDYSDAIDRNLERISAATEGFVFSKDGVIKHLQELARQIGERISNLVNNLMGRLSPQ